MDSHRDLTRWHAYQSGSTLGTIGSENGEVIRDEGHDIGARMTLERGGRAAAYAITLGVYGYIVHTRFFRTMEDATREFDAMKVALEPILGMIQKLDEWGVKHPDPRVSKHVMALYRRFE